MARNGLTDKQRAFVDYYLQTWNAAEAARLAGYSPKTARFIGFENLSKPNIAEIIEQRQQELFMSANEALLRETQIARFDISPYLEGYGRRAVVRIDKMIEDGYGHLIREIWHTAEGTRVKIADADGARERILKAHGVLSSGTSVSVQNNTAVQIKVTYDDADDHTPPPP